MGQRDRAYADVVAALVQARETPATERFDAVIRDAVAAGALDPELARTLRWWQRASVLEVAEHASTVLPPVFASLIESAGAAADAVAVADQAWRDAGGQTPVAGNQATGRHAPRTVDRTPDTNVGDDSGISVPKIASEADTGSTGQAESPAEPSPVAPDDATAPDPDGPDSADATHAAAAADAALRRRLVVAGLTRTG